MGDFVRGRLQGRFPQAIESGIRLHRHIDAFTDRHPAVRRSRARLPPSWRRYGGILLDVFYDHFLAREWEQRHPEPLERFAERVYARLEAEHDHLDARLQVVAPRLKEHNVLVAYRDRAGVARALASLSRRLSRPNPLGQAITLLDADDGSLYLGFCELLPALESFARQQAEALRQ